MSPNALVPYIPETAPFTEEQRQWLNGFLAGIFSGAPVPAGVGTADAGAPAPAAPAPVEKKPMLILYGSQTGNAEGLAKKLKTTAEKRGFAPKLHDLSKVEPAELAKAGDLLLITSTWGEGDPPDNAAGFWDKLQVESHPRLENLRYSVLALGDRNYEDFCGCGRKFDERLAALGARRLRDRQDCDTDYDAPAQAWMEAVLERLNQPADAGKQDAPPTALGHHDEGRHMDPGADELAARGEPMRSDGIVPPRDISGVSVPPAPAPVASYSKANPFPARLLVNRRLTSNTSEKETRHYEIDLSGSGLTYEVGDALGVVPTNCPELVGEMLRALGFDGEEEVTGVDGQPKPIRLALERDYAIRAPHKEFLAVLAARDHADAFLKDLLNPGVRTELDLYLLGRELIDFLLESPKLGFAPQEFVSLLRKMQPRLYSIASSLKAHPDQVHLTVDTLRYEAHGRGRKGVSSTFLADRVGETTTIPVFIQQAKHFRPPEDKSRPMVMVGPGTGIAPFRAFLQERQATAAPGKNWLFFGAQRAASDFFYREELEAMRSAGYLHQLSTAFSRDQAEKIYVQTRMLENAPELWQYLEEDAHFYVCGDAKRMAKDVDAALHQVIQTAGGRSEDEAKEYVAKLKKEKRYQRDVY